MTKTIQMVLTAAFFVQPAHAQLVVPDFAFRGNQGPTKVQRETFADLFGNEYAQHLPQSESENSASIAGTDASDATTAYDVEKISSEPEDVFVEEDIEDEVQDGTTEAVSDSPQVLTESLLSRPVSDQNAGVVNGEELGERDIWDRTSGDGTRREFMNKNGKRVVRVEYRAGETKQHVSTLSESEQQLAALPSMRDVWDGLSEYVLENTAPIRQKSKLFHVMIVSVKRRDDEYISWTLPNITTALQQMPGVTCSLFDANNPPEKHTYLLNWCAKYPDLFNCVLVPPMAAREYKPLSLLTTTSDDENTLRWRTKENFDSGFAMTYALKAHPDVERFVWFEDDVRIPQDLFANLMIPSVEAKSDERVCLRNQHGGSVCWRCCTQAYALSRNFLDVWVDELGAPTNFYRKAIDQILDHIHGPWSKIEMVDHIG